MTLVAHCDPEKDPGSGPNYFELDEYAVYDINVNKTGSGLADIEIIYSVIEKHDPRRPRPQLHYKICDIDEPRGSWEAQVLDEIAPVEDEMIFRKTSSSVFISTNIDYILRNLEVRSLIVAGVMTDQCVESAVRDACDLGYLVTLVATPAPQSTGTFLGGGIRGVPLGRIRYWQGSDLPSDERRARP